ncbi:MAG: 23S rRNA (pseudouridine(1915)-N(3))-methyltransferase RlmH [Bacteroidia bacterium]|nr:23S rRNA (pseudouridine(1915)-N(3))-methyltransferase RlmH [Bacteroidia bacterium]
MLHIKLLQVGKTFQPFVQEGITEFEKRLKHYCTLETITISDVKNAANLTHEQVKKQESIIILKHVTNTDTLLLLDERGIQYTSVELANYFNKQINAGVKKITVVIGGAFGFDESVYARANGLISLSKLTFSHQMVRLFLVEQIYRAFTIIKGEKYHHQ